MQLNSFWILFYPNCRIVSRICIWQYVFSVITYWITQLTLLCAYIFNVCLFVNHLSCYCAIPIVAIPAPTNIKKIPNASARQACHKHLEVIFPRTTWTFHVAPEKGKQIFHNQNIQFKLWKKDFPLPEAGQALRTGPNDIFRRLCHFVATPRACISKTRLVFFFTSVWILLFTRCSQNCHSCFCIYTKALKRIRR